LKARVLESRRGLSYLVGETLVGPKHTIMIQCGRGLLSKAGGDFLIIEKLQLEGEEPIESSEFLEKFPDFIGTIAR